MATKKKLQAPETALVLRTCFADLTSYGGFQWPDEVSSVVEFADWNPEAVCGGGGHGWLFGQGDAGASSSIGIADAKWLVVEVPLPSVVALGGKVKFPSCIIRHIGDKTSATQYLLEHEVRAASVAVIGITLTGGDRSTLTGGDDSTLTGGNRSTLTGGYGSTITGGYGSTITGGVDSTLTGGDKSELRIRKWCSKSERYRTHQAYVGENGIQAGLAYRLDEGNKFVEA
ncbi:hypothetical protein [Pseudomonas petrae]|uniref:hypothetical protein n=1 Tax=Pseudomonas petrae TaxID=2912190 RepID=UPI001F41D92A|nr:hypothetical protein [Pseudomonas petrae]MCF7536193.1 hypothetical protein [Pseudomonas petrae]